MESDLRLPESTFGIVLLAPANGSARHSPRNQFVAEMISRKTGCRK